MTRKSGLGRGLDALIPVGSFQPEMPAKETGGIVEIPVKDILPNPRQPRGVFNEEELAELADSIRQHGILQPLLVTRGVQPDSYILIAGERRLMAARLAKLELVPAILREINEQQRLELALIENLQRTDLSPLETAEAYRQLAEDFGLAHEEIASQVGKSRTAVTNTLRLLKLSAPIKKALAEGLISEGHARALLALSTHQAQTAALNTVIKNNLNVRQTEELVRKLSGQKPETSIRSALPPELIEIEDRLRETLGTKVTLSHGQKGGTLVIHYYSDEELEALVDKIIKE